MKVSDYIVEYLIEKGITDTFGYPGGMVTHLMESFSKYKGRISAHVTYHEQAAAFAACGYAQVSGKLGVAYATSGPGATNLLTGICNAYFDSIPTLFITGQVNTFESKGSLGIRQRGFQETDVVSMCRGVTKYAEYVSEARKIKYFLDKAYYYANEGRKGPVVLDIPMNVLRAEIDIEELESFIPNKKELDCTNLKNVINTYLKSSNRPVIILGNGVKISQYTQKTQEIIEKLKLPVVTSMIAFDVIGNSEWNLGFIGAYGHRAANFAVAKSDLIIAVGTRMDIRQVGVNRENFAPNAQIIRIDIDNYEAEYKVHSDEIHIKCDVKDIFSILSDFSYLDKYDEWRKVCRILKTELYGIDIQNSNLIIAKLSEQIDKDVIITTDVGQNQVWVAQSFKLKEKQKVLFSGGHGAMGYSLPAAIGAYYASKKPVICFSGDGGFQMNIQELQFVIREKLPIKMIVLNNNALGMIRHFQEMYFNGNYFMTKPEGGYTTPDFVKIANAYGICALKIKHLNDLELRNYFHDDKPLLLEVMIEEDTYVFPKLEFGKPNQDQEPLLSREKYQRLMNL